MSVWLARVMEAMFWWGACLGIWLISLSAVSGQELLVATIVSLPCGVLAVVGRVAATNRWGFRVDWIRSAGLVPFAIVSDAFQVLFWVLRSPGGAGEFVKIPIADGAGDGPRADGRRATATLLTTLTPSSVVVDIDPETGEALVHVIPVRGPHMERLAAR